MSSCCTQLASRGPWRRLEVEASSTHSQRSVPFGLLLIVCFSDTRQPECARGFGGANYLRHHGGTESFLVLRDWLLPPLNARFSTLEWFAGANRNFPGHG